MDQGLSLDEWQAVRLSLEVATRSVAVSLVPAVAIAWVLVRCRFPGRMLLDAVVLLPLVVPPVVVGAASAGAAAAVNRVPGQVIPAA